MMSKLDKRMTIASILLLILLAASIFALSKMTNKAPECHMKQDCDQVKTTCDRKKGCKCKLNCDPEGRRLPPAGGVSECPSFCCEEKCECHGMGCP
jgi:hypothetical protein